MSRPGWRPLRSRSPVTVVTFGHLCAESAESHRDRARRGRDPMTVVAVGASSSLRVSKVPTVMGMGEVETERNERERVREEKSRCGGEGRRGEGRRGGEEERGEKSEQRRERERENIKERERESEEMAEREERGDRTKERGGSLIESGPRIYVPRAVLCVACSCVCIRVCGF